MQRPQTRSLRVYYKSTDSHSSLLYSSSHPSQVKNSIPFSQFLRLRRLCSDDSDFSNKSEVIYQFFNKRGYPVVRAGHHVLNKLIDSQLYKRHKRKTLTAFHLLLHFTLTTTQLNLSFSKTLHNFKMIQRLVLSFSNLH